MKARHSHFLTAQRPTERRYRLELSDDLGSLRPLVPPHPDFSSGVHGGFPSCCRPPVRHTFDAPAPPVERTEYRFSHLAGSCPVTGLVGRPGTWPFPRRPNSDAGIKDQIGSNGGISPPSARCNRTSPIKGIRLQQ
uniref:Uncharacterized protein n=1 Tax=Komagataeibacter europaeus TaxID=33995 RepID=A0A089ZZ69_KOMEU|nr:hypothetical protein [Komagataeibacter europaeus]